MIITWQQVQIMRGESPKSYVRVVRARPTSSVNSSENFTDTEFSTWWLLKCICECCMLLTCCIFCEWYRLRWINHVKQKWINWKGYHTEFMSCITIYYDIIITYTFTVTIQYIEIHRIHTNKNTSSRPSSSHRVENSVSAKFSDELTLEVGLARTTRT